MEENRSEFSGVGSGVELGQVAYPCPKERRPKWPFGLKLCKWEFMELLAVGRIILVMRLWMDPGRGLC